MRKVFTIFICMAIVFSFVACNNNATNESKNETIVDAEFTEIENKTIVAKDGTEYTFVGVEGKVHCVGVVTFIGHIKGEEKSFNHLGTEIRTGMYSVNGGQDVLVRFLPDSEFASIYVKSNLLKTEVSLDNCIEFKFVNVVSYNNIEIFNSTKGITECKQFLNEIKAGQKAEDAGLYDLVRQPDGMLHNCYVYGYVCGVLQEDINLVVPMKIISFDDKAYSITIEDIEYVLPNEWADKLITEQM